MNITGINSQQSFKGVYVRMNENKHMEMIEGDKFTKVAPAKIAQSKEVEKLVLNAKHASVKNETGDCFRVDGRLENLLVILTGDDALKLRELEENSGKTEKWMKQATFLADKLKGKFLFDLLNFDFERIIK